MNLRKEILSLNPLWEKEKTCEKINRILREDLKIANWLYNKLAEVKKLIEEKNIHEAIRKFEELKLTLEKTTDDELKAMRIRKPGIFKKTLVALALIASTIGVYTPKAQAQQTLLLNNKTEATQIGNTVYVNNKRVGENYNDGRILMPDGTSRNADIQNITPGRYGYAQEEAPHQMTEYQRKIAEYDAKIRKDMTAKNIMIKINYQQEHNAPAKDIEPDLKKGVKIIEQELKNKIDKNNEVMYNGFAVGYEKIGHYQEAIAIYKNLDKLFPTHNYQFPIKQLQEKIKN